MQKDQFVKEQLRQKLLEMLPKQNRGNSDSKHRKFLIQCIEDHGYISKKQFVDPGSDPESDFEPEPRYDPDPDPEAGPGPSTWAPGDYGYTRTFIDHPGSRLAELQQRGITSEETEFNKVVEIMDAALHKIQQKHPDVPFQQVKIFANTEYQKLMRYYSSGNVHNFKSNSQSIKRGYIAMIVWYALVEFGLVIQKDELIKYFPKVTIADLFEPGKYLKVILPSLPEPQKKLCGGMETELKIRIGEQLVSKVFKVLENFDNSPKYTAAAVYYICSVPIHKGGILPKKTKDITLDFLSSHCKVNSSTISKGVQDIIAFYQRSPELKDLIT